MEAWATSALPGANGLFFLPTIMGERTPWWDANCRGTLIGMSLNHTHCDVARSCYEGVAQALHLCADALWENLGQTDMLTLVGGGVHSYIWPQMLTDMLQIPARIHAHPREATSLGAAMLAGVGAGIYPNYAEAAKAASYKEALTPDTSLAEAYAAHYAVYRSLYENFREAYARISAYQENK